MNRRRYVVPKGDSWVRVGVTTSDHATRRTRVLIAIPGGRRRRSLLVDQPVDSI